jgi:glycosyltransferase involved in cell wall biosynthesis
MLFYTSEELSIVFIHSHVLCRIPTPIPRFQEEGYFSKSNNTVIFLSFSWYYPREKYYIKPALESGIVPMENFYVFLNSPEELKIFQNDFPKCNSYIINNACWIDECNFRYLPNTDKIYDAFMNAKAEPFKNHVLAKHVENLCLVINGNELYKDKINSILKPVYINESVLTYGELSKLINKSYVALILSEEEGACYASAEYLSCGCPVISVKSRGGRDVYYNENNSIICNLDTMSICEAVKEAKEKVKDGTFSAEEIRADFLDKAQSYRDTFIDMLDKVFRKFNIEEDAKRYLEENYKNKFLGLRIS